MSEPATDQGYWLPEDYELQLTAFELGGLLSALLVAKSHGVGCVTINKPGPKGEKIEITLIDRLIEKVVKLT